MPPKRVAVSRGQLTLFQCAAKKQKRSSDPIEDRESELESQEGELDSNQSESETESEPDSSDLITDSPSHMGQDNYITVDRPSGSTTIIVNAKAPRQSPSVCPQTKQHLPPTDLSSGPLQLPTQPKINFPTRSFGQGRPRAFNCEWYKSFRWIEYSIQQDAAFCYACRHFTTGIGRSENTFRITGFRDWKHAIGKKGVISVHDTCSTHKQAMSSWNEYTLNSERHTSIANRLDSARAQLVKSNHHYIKTIAEVILLCAKQELALRGHRESAKSQNRGNFLEILSLVARHDPVIR